MALHRPYAAKRQATYAVEFSLVFPVLILFMFAIFEYGRFLMVRQLLDNAAREAARQAAVQAGFVYDPTTHTVVSQTLTTANIQTTVINFLAGQPLENTSGKPLGPSDIQVYRADPTTGLPMTDAKGSLWTNASFGESIAVAVTCQYQPMLPGWGFLVNPDPITFICLMRSEANS
jgi:Flp pilus assembly protein TadG